MLLVAVALTLSACGSSGDGEDSTASSSSPKATTGSTSTTTSSTTTKSPAKTTATDSPAASGDGDVRQAFDSILRRSLVQQGQLSEAEIDCVLGELHRTLPNSQIEASTTKQVPQEVVNAASRAGLKCVGP
jgi:hypothetical protein